MEQVYLSRRNLLTLLSKLDRKKKGEQTTCTIVKNDKIHPVYPQTMDMIAVTAVEDDKYYIDRKPGVVLSKDNPELSALRCMLESN